MKLISRQGWKNELSLEHPESVADHSYSVTALTMLFSDMMNLDTSKSMKMAILHDLAESITGDLTPDDISKPDKRILEDKTMNEIFKKIPINLIPSYKLIWQEFQNDTTQEAKLVHDIDKLEMALQAKNYQNNGSSKEKIQTFMATAQKEIRHPKLKEFLKQLLD